MSWQQEAITQVEPLLKRVEDAPGLFVDLVDSQNAELLVENLAALDSDRLRDIVLERVVTAQARRRLGP